MTFPVTEEQFLKNVEHHAMTVIRDDGVYRHLRFAKPGTGNQRFDLLTWPGHLCFTGDMGTYVFSRLEDMFEFFRTDRLAPHKDGRQLYINPSYWSEKVLAADKSDGITEFSEEKFRREVLSTLTSWLRRHRDDTSKDERRDLWDAVISDVLNAVDDGEHAAYRSAYEFSHRANSCLEFEFVDFWENRLEEFSFYYAWCCYAIAWGIQKYDDRADAERAA